MSLYTATTNSKCTQQGRSKWDREKASPRNYYYCYNRKVKNELAGERGMGVPTEWEKLAGKENDMSPHPKLGEPKKKDSTGNKWPHSQ